MKKIGIKIVSHFKKDDFMFMLIPTFGFLKDEGDWSINFVWLGFDLQIGNL